MKICLRFAKPGPLALALSITFLAIAGVAVAQQVPTQINEIITIAARTCKQVQDCEEAVILWCNGYRRADADRDGIPCENVCRNLTEVNGWRRQVGC